MDKIQTCWLYHKDQWSWPSYVCLVVRELFHMALAFEQRSKGWVGEVGVVGPDRGIVMGRTRVSERTKCFEEVKEEEGKKHESRWHSVSALLKWLNGGAIYGGWSPREVVYIWENSKIQWACGWSFELNVLLQPRAVLANSESYCKSLTEDLNVGCYKILPFDNKNKC